MTAFPTRRTHRPSRWATLGALGLASALVLAGCSGDGDEQAPETEATQGTAAETTSVEIPDTPAGEKANQVIEALNAEDDAVAEDWEGEFHESFTAQVPVEDFVELLNAQIRPAQPFTPVAYEGGDRQSVTTLESPASDPVDLTVVLDPDGLIIGLTVTPATPDT